MALLVFLLYLKNVLNVACKFQVTGTFINLHSFHILLQNAVGAVGQILYYCCVYIICEGQKVLPICGYIKQ